MAYRSTMITPTQRNPYINVLGEDISMAETLDDALTLGGLNWTVATRPMEGVFTDPDTDTAITFTHPDKNIIYRTDTHQAITTVGRRNTPIQNEDMFAIAQAAINRGAHWDRAGSLNGGNTVFMSLSLPEYTTNVGGNDIVSWALQLRNNFDGARKATASLEATRLICTNGMTTQMKHAYVFNVRHTKNATDIILNAEDLLKKSLMYVKEFNATADTLINTNMTKEEFTHYIDTLYPQPDKKENPRAHTVWMNRRDELMHLFTHADTNEEGRGTRWAAYNSITEYLDWGSNVHSRGTTMDTARAISQFNNAARHTVRAHAMSLLTA